MPDAADTRKRGRHSQALTRVLKATGLANVPEEAMLVELLRDYALDLDNGAGARTRTQYLSALKDLRRVMNAGTGRPRGTAEPSKPKPEPVVEPSTEAEPLPEPNDLAKFKERHGISA